MGRTAAVPRSALVSSNNRSGPAALRDVLRGHLVERGITNKLGDPNWVAFAELLDGYKYESLRKAIAGDRPPTMGLMEACAEALSISPDEFIEYRILAAQRMFDPREVGMEQALKNLDTWAKTQK